MSDTALDPFVEIFSPVPPMRTGPADYLATLLERVSKVAGCTQRITIAIDPDFLPDGEAMPVSIHGARVEDYRSFDDNVPLGRTRIFFLANNDHHAYVFAALARQRSLAEGRIISVLHDVSSFMLHRFRLGNGHHRLSEKDVVAAATPQYGTDAAALINSRLYGEMPEIFEYITHCQALALANSHEIWVHSLFAAAKLLCESDVRASHIPILRVCAHPLPDSVLEPHVKPLLDRFRIGIFGWVTPPKRVASAVHGLSLAFDRLPEQARSEIELIIAGRKPADSSLEPLDIAKRLNVAHAVRMIDFPDNAALRSLQASCQLILNFRYPSCGESSGTLALARATNAKVVVSRYQAFHEVTATGGSVTTLPRLEEWDIASRISTAYADWQQAAITLDPSSAESAFRKVPSGREICPAEKLLMNEVIARGIAAKFQTHPEMLT